MKNILISYFSHKASDLLKEGNNKGYAYMRAVGTLTKFESISKRDIIEGKITGKYIGDSIQSQMRELVISETFGNQQGLKPFSMNPHKHYTNRNEVFNKIIPLLKLLNQYCIDYVICGSYRRECLYVGDVDILIFQKFPDISSLNCEIVSKGEKLMKLKFKEIEVDMRSFDPDCRGPALVFYTGPKNFNIWLRSEAKKKGFKLNEYCLSDGIRKFKFSSEEELFKFLDIDYIKPKEREVWR